MIGLPNQLWRPEGSRWMRAFVFAALVALGGTLPAQASPIRASSHQVRVAQQVLDLRSWTSFLARGPSLWAWVPAPPVTLGVRQAIAQALASPDPTSNPLVEYLTWRRNLDPTRFDRWHPNVGPELQDLPLPVTTPSTTTLSTTTPATTATAPPGSQQLNPLIAPTPSPEPGSYVIALALLGAGVWWRRRGGLPSPTR